jgi:molybdopterin-guanine dinucleotide biosynthesis protein A
MPAGEICILAGGLSARMGRDKSRLRLGGKTLLGHVRATARQTGWPVRTIRRDLVPRCGPLGGVWTALKSTDADRVLFLACDMPFVPVDLLDKLIRMSGRPMKPIFVRGSHGPAGFPFVLQRDCLGIVAQQIQDGDYSLQSLARRVKAKQVRAPDQCLRNINTPAEFRRAEKLGPVAAHFQS